MMNFLLFLLSIADPYLLTYPNCQYENSKRSNEIRHELISLDSLKNVPKYVFYDASINDTLIGVSHSILRFHSKDNDKIKKVDFDFFSIYEKKSKKVVFERTSGQLKIALQPELAIYELKMAKKLKSNDKLLEGYHLPRTSNKTMHYTKFIIYPRKNRSTAKNK